VLPLYTGIHQVGSRQYVLLTSPEAKVARLNDCDLERMIRDNVSDSSRSSIDQFISTFNNLKSDFDRGIAIQTTMTVYRILPVLKEVHAAGKFKSSYLHPLPLCSLQPTRNGKAFGNATWMESRGCQIQ
jgi:hypothetical protein